MKFITFVLMFLMFFFVSCGSDTVKTNKTGEDGYPCYNNKTCNGELVCVEDICVDPVDDTDNTDIDVIDETGDSSDDDIIIETDNEPVDNDSVEPDNIPTDEDSETEHENDTDYVIENDTDINEPDNTQEDIDNIIPDEDTVEMYNGCVVPAEGLETTLLTWDCVGGNWWSKEIVVYEYLTKYNFTKIEEILNEVNNKCNEIGGRLPTVTEFRKIMDVESCPDFAYPETENGCPISDNIDSFTKDDNFRSTCFQNCKYFIKKLKYITIGKIFKIDGENGFVMLGLTDTYYYKIDYYEYTEIYETDEKYGSHCVKL